MLKLLTLTQIVLKLKDSEKNGLFKPSETCHFL